MNPRSQRRSNLVELARDFVDAPTLGNVSSQSRALKKTCNLEYIAGRSEIGGVGPEF
jgi:hypothetical protein